MRRTLGAFGFLLAVAAGPAFAQDAFTETREMRIQVQPLFFVESDADGSGSVDLGSGWKGGGENSDTVRVVVHSNRGTPYRIIHRLEQELLNERGQSMPERRVLFSVSNGVRGGLSEVKSPQPLTQDPVVIFSSSGGEADEFNIFYINSSDKMVPAGTYRARILIEGELR